MTAKPCLHSGHVLALANHLVMHSVWNPCLHPRQTCVVSPPPRSVRQHAHSEFLGRTGGTENLALTVHPDSMRVRS